MSPRGRPVYGRIGLLGLAIVTALVMIGLNPFMRSAQALQPPERIIVHIPLTFNDGKPVSRPELNRLIADLGVLGAVAEHRGYGTYVDAHGRVSVEPIDHAVVRTASPRAERVVVAMLRRMRRDLRQESTLAEVIPDPGTWREEQPRVQFDVVIAAQRAACDRTCTTLRRLLDTAGGGDSEYEERARAHVMSSVPVKYAMHVRTALRALRLSFTEHRAAFVLVTT